MKLINAMLSYGYVEETSHGSLWVTTQFGGTDKEFLDELKKLFRGCYKELYEENNVPSKCCVKNKKYKEFKFCPECRKPLNFELTEEAIDEEIGNWFISIVQGTYDSVGYDITDWMEEHNILFGFREDAVGKASILYDIQAFDRFLIGDNRMVHIKKYNTTITDEEEIHLECKE